MRNMQLPALDLLVVYFDCTVPCRSREDGSTSTYSVRTESPPVRGEKGLLSRCVAVEHVGAMKLFSPLANDPRPTN